MCIRDRGGLGSKKAVDALDVDDEALARELGKARAASPSPARPVDAARAARLARARAIVDEAMGND